VQRFGGVLLFTIGAGFTAYRWYAAAHGPPIYAGKAEAIFPAFAAVGIALVLIPGYREERLARGEDITALRGAALITPRWWAVLVVALVCGAANFAAFFLRYGA
jgi:hypothetical protein